MGSINSEAERDFEVDTDDQAVASLQVSARMLGTHVPDSKLFRNSLTGKVHMVRKGSQEFLCCSRFSGVQYAQLLTGAAFDDKMRCKDCYGLRGLSIAD